MGVTSGLSREYIAGLYDGDGSFSVELSKRLSIPTGFQIKPCIALNLSEKDSIIFNDIIATFPELNFTIQKGKLGNVCLRLRKESDVVVFLGEVLPFMRVFSSLQRARILKRIVDTILSSRRGMSYGSEKHFDKLLCLILQMRRYSKRHRGINSHDIVTLLRKRGVSVSECHNSMSLEEEAKDYVPEDFGLEYLAGLFDAEGYVGIYVHRCPRSRFGYYFRPIINLNLAIYDAGILYKLRDKFADLKPRIKIRKENNTAYFQIDNAECVGKFIRMLYPYVKLPTMRVRMELVLQAIELIMDKAHYNEQGWKELRSIVERLRTYSKRRRSRVIPY